MPVTILEFINIISGIIGAGKNAYEFYQEVFGNNQGGFAAMVTQLETDLTAIIHIELETAAITTAQGVAQTGVDFLSVNLPNEVQSHTNAEIFAYLSESDASNALTDASNQANTMEQWSLQNDLTDTETMEAIQTLPLYLLLGNICLSIYQARALYATDASDQATNWNNVKDYATRFQVRAAQIFNVLQAGRLTYISTYWNTENEGDNPPYSSWANGWYALKDEWISSESMLKYSWYTKTDESGTKGNVGVVTTQVDQLQSLHQQFLQSPDYPSYDAILQAANKSDQLPQATHFEDYFSKHPAYPPSQGYASEVYQWGLFYLNLQNAINALGRIAQNPAQPCSLMQPPTQVTSYSQYGFGGEFQNGSGPAPWTPGYSVQYAISFYLGLDPTNPDFESAIGPWSAVISSEVYYYPMIVDIQRDPSGLATGRKIYRQFQGQGIEYVGAVTDNIGTAFQDDTNQGTPVNSAQSASA